MSNERLGEGTPCRRLQYRCFRFNEVPLVQELPDCGNNLAALLKNIPCLSIGNEVEVALPVACVDVAESMPLLRQWL